MTLRPIARYLAGVALWVFYHTGGRADPVESGEVANADEVMPFFVLSELPVGLSSHGPQSHFESCTLLYFVLITTT